MRTYPKNFTEAQRKHIAEEFKQFRLTRYLTRNDLAELLDVTSITIENIEKVKHEPRMRTYSRFLELRQTFGGQRECRKEA